MPEYPTDAHFSFTFVFKQALNGDSGGLVYGVDAKLNKAAGINIGAATINGSNMGIFCKASTVLTDLGLSMY